MQDEPFSTRPPQLASYIAAVIKFDFPLCELFCRSGLLGNPSNHILLNNLSVALANQDRLDEAEEEYRKIDWDSASNAKDPTRYATKGLIAFRRGNFDQGRELYQMATDAARARDAKEDLVLAYIHWAREEMMAQTDKPLELIARAKSAIKSVDLPELSSALDSFIAITSSLGEKK